jgi:cation transport regulator ChaB
MTWARSDDRRRTFAKLLGCGDPSLEDRRDGRKQAGVVVTASKANWSAVEREETTHTKTAHGTTLRTR